LRTHDTVGRLGGDEFVALLTGPIDRPGLDLLAQRLHTTLEEPIVIAGVTVHTQASIGIVDVEPDDTRDASALLRDADLAMYSAKTTAQGTTCHFTEHLHEQLARVRREVLSAPETSTLPIGQDQPSTLSSANSVPKHFVPASFDGVALDK
jgi:GGDEF domain-containing protein